MSLQMVKRSTHVWAASWQNQQNRPVWSESSLCAQWVAKDPNFLHADSEDSDQTGRKTRLIWVFAGRTLTLLVLSRGGSYVNVKKIYQFFLLLKYSGVGTKVNRLCTWWALEVHIKGKEWLWNAHHVLMDVNVSSDATVYVY